MSSSTQNDQTSSSTDAKSTSTSNGNDGTAKKTNNTTNDESCVICLGPIRTPTHGDNCTHQFCFNCILRWMNNNNTCPLCRKVLSETYNPTRRARDNTAYNARHIRESEMRNHPDFQLLWDNRDLVLASFFIMLELPAALRSQSQDPRRPDAYLIPLPEEDDDIDSNSDSD
jgi:Ring finger domain